MNKYIFLVFLLVKFIYAQQQTGKNKTILLIETNLKLYLKKECQRTHMTHVPGNCDKFYLCFQDRLITMSCPKGYLFDSKTKRCQDESKVICPSFSSFSISIFN
jgi:hypothetical protein